MTHRPIPERPNLEQLKKQAKTLLRNAQAGDPAALHRFHELPAFATHPIDHMAVAELALHDAQSAIAREHGFDSWNALRENVEERTLTFEAALDDFLRCATGGVPARAERLLALYPGIAGASLHTALVLGDAATVEARLRAHPALATTPGGPQEWEPLLYACHTCMHRGQSDRIEGLMAIARLLLSLGANPNAEYHWNWHPELPRTALWAALCAVSHLPLAEVLLEGGANPTDGVSMHITGGGGNIAALDLLHRFGVNVNGIPGGVPPLVYMLGWATDAAGPRWLLEHGADANLAWGADGDAPLHVAARRWDVPMVELLVGHGASITQRRADGRAPHTVASLAGNQAVAEWLRGHGAPEELSALERFVSACARGDRVAAATMLGDQPTLRDELRTEHHLLLHRPAESGQAAVLETMLACGFDPAVADRDGVTPLHRAAMGGHPEAVRVLLAHGAPVNALDGMFAATPLIWAVEGWGKTRSADAGQVGAARLLIAAGSSVEWVPPEGAPSPERTLEGLIDLRRLAAQTPNGGAG